MTVPFQNLYCFIIMALIYKDMRLKSHTSIAGDNDETLFCINGSHMNNQVNNLV